MNVILCLVSAILSVKPTHFGAIKNGLMKDNINYMNNLNCNVGQYDLKN
jgi:hypothetical protein